MIDNCNLLQKLIDEDKIRIHDSPILHTFPPQLPSDFDFSKVEGMLLGAAIGDSLGATSEGILPSERKKQFGEIKDYIPGRRSKYRPVGVPTDDTQLTFWTLKQLILDGGLVPDNLAKRFCKHHIRGIGTTTREFIKNYKDNNVPWYEAGVDSLGNGALMRISPIIIPYLKNPHTSIYADAALDAMITHNSYANIACCIAFVNILWQLLTMKSAPESRWWINSYCSVAEELEGITQYSPRVTKYSNFKGSLWQFTEKVVTGALDSGLSVLDACEHWGSGANLFETIPSVIYILAKHAQNPKEAIIRAVNDTKDNDTVAAIVGAAVGALYGLNGLPERWIEGLTGRTRSSDDGQVFKLILLAKKRFWI
jgi:ADP-ribosylglycohydrolase